MGWKHIRLDDYFVYKDKQKYYLTSVDDISVWRGMSDEEKKKVKGEDVTKSVKRYIKKHSLKRSLNVRTKPSKKQIKKTKQKKKKVTIEESSGGCKPKQSIAIGG